MGVLIIVLAYQLVILPVAYVKVFFHKFALVVNNPQGVGSKSRSNRLGYAVFFAFVGPFILVANYFVDIYWFFKHVYMTEAQVDGEDSSQKGLKKSVDRKTFKKMLQYFVHWDDDYKLRAKQLVLQKEVCQEIREHLGVQLAIEDMVMGRNPLPEP